MAEPVECPAIGLTAVVVLVEGVGHRWRPIEDWPPDPIARCGAWTGQDPVTRPHWYCMANDIPLCTTCWPRSPDH